MKTKNIITHNLAPCGLVVALLLLAAPSHCNAALVLELDTVGKTFSLTGTDNGTFADFGDYSYAGWQANRLGGGVKGMGSQTKINLTGIWASLVGSG